jgi:hypothetical protein
MSKLHHVVLAAAARDAMRAPSVFNTQPWRWRIDGDALELRADRNRQLAVADPDGRLLLLSCGAAMHHARVAIAAAGWSVQVRRLVKALSDDLLARVNLAGRHRVRLEDHALHGAMASRRTDRRPFGDVPVPPEVIRRLVGAAKAEGVQLHRVPMDQMPTLAVAVAVAGAQEMANPEYRKELIRWTNRPDWSGDGVPANTTVRRVLRRVPVRELAVEPREGVPIEPGGDRGAVYLVLFGESDEPRAWLQAGEALSAVLLTAVTLGLSVAPISDVIEVERTREVVRDLLDARGHPYVVIRCGLGTSTSALAEAPRRDPEDVIEGLPVWW